MSHTCNPGTVANALLQRIIENNGKSATITMKGSGDTITLTASYDDTKNKESITHVVCTGTHPCVKASFHGTLDEIAEKIIRYDEIKAEFDERKQRP